MITNRDQYREAYYLMMASMEPRGNWTPPTTSFSENKEERTSEGQMPGDIVTYEVMRDLATRSQVGIQKYNTTLFENNHQNMIQHGYEEALDLAQYLKKYLMSMEVIQDLINRYPNDQELGEKIREYFSPKTKQEKV